MKATFTPTGGIKLNIQNAAGTYVVPAANLLAQIKDQLELQQCYCNFMRPHRALKFGTEVYTPAMMAKIADHKVSWAEVLQLYLAAIAKLLIGGTDNI